MSTACTRLVTGRVMRRQCVSGESWDAFFGHDFPLRGRINDKIDMIFPTKGQVFRHLSALFRTEYPDFPASTGCGDE
jgi:hypothetical protein